MYLFVYIATVNIYWFVTAWRYS